MVETVAAGAAVGVGAGVAWGALQAVKRMAIKMSIAARMNGFRYFMEHP
jgi:hypothetical protein